MVSQDKELELINTIKEMLKNGDSEEDIISILEGLGLDRNYIKQLIEKAKNGKTLHDFVKQQNVDSQKPQENNQIVKQKIREHKTVDVNDEDIKKLLDEIEILKKNLEEINKKLDKMENNFERIKEDTESTRLILEKLMKVYRVILNKILSKYT